MALQLNSSTTPQVGTSDEAQSDNENMVASLRATLKERKLMNIADVIYNVEKLDLARLTRCSPDNLKELLSELLDGNHGIDKSNIQPFIKTVSSAGASVSVDYVRTLRAELEKAELSYISALLENQEEPLTLSDLMKMSRDNIWQVLRSMSRIAYDSLTPSPVSRRRNASILSVWTRTQWRNGSA